MRIKDLATRATKLLTGNAWFVVDNGTKVEKAAYSEVVKQGIEEYAGSTLAGSAQTVKSAIDALNNSMTKFTGNSSAGATFTIPNGYRGKLITIDSNGNRCGEWIVWATGAGAIGIKNTVTASLIEVTSEQNNKLKITPTDSGSPIIIFENYSLVATKD